MKLSVYSAAALGCLLSACFVDRGRYLAGGGDSATETGVSDVATDGLSDSGILDSGVAETGADVPEVDSGPPLAPRLISPLSTTNVTTRNVRVTVDLGDTDRMYGVEFNRSPTFDLTSVGGAALDRGRGRRSVIVQISPVRMGDPRGTWFFRACDMRAARGVACSPVWSINVLTESMTESKAGHGVAADVLGDGAQDVLVTSRVIQPPTTLSHLSRTYFYSSFGSGSPLSTGVVDECTQVHMPVPDCATFNGGFLLGVLSSVIGDATGDGRADVALYGAQGSASMLGTIAVLSGGAMPSYLQRITAASSVPFAGGASSAGDFNGDGLADMAAIVTVPSGMVTRRRLDVFLASRGGAPFAIDRRVALPLPPPEMGDIPTPARVTAIGDLNSDGYADLAVRGTNTVTGAGELWIYSGNADPMTTTPAFARIGGAMRANWAMSIAGGGDADNDGIADVYVGWGEPMTTMSVSVVHGSGTGAPSISDELQRILPWPSGVAGLSSPLVITAGDVTGDGLIDALLLDNAGSVAKIDVSSRDAGGVFSLLTTPIRTMNMAERFNARISVRDINRDGRAEVLVPVRPTGTGDGGPVRVYSLSTSGASPTSVEITSPDPTGVLFGIDAL